ncbi:MAG: hypothetical protein OXC12_14730 [Spirochaetaceae bacterium]|nr:hypothetical protein [Spirochaetaceae bacterium]
MTDQDLQSIAAIFDDKLKPIHEKLDRLNDCFDRFLSAHQSETAAQIRRDLNAPLPHEKSA